MIKQDKVKYTYQIADKLKRGRRTIYNWLKMYSEKGIEEYLTVSPRGKANDIFEEFLDDFSKTNPKELKLLIIDNAGFHACQNITIPDNIKLIRIPAYAPELNPAEKVWQWMKGKVAMKFFNSTKMLQNKITEMVGQLSPHLIKSITG